jgi:hypothetical protein
VGERPFGQQRPGADRPVAYGATILGGNFIAERDHRVAAKTVGSLLSTITDRHPNRDSNSQRDADGHAHTHQQPNSDQHVDPDQDTDQHGDCHSHAYSNGKCDGDSNQHA